MAENEMVERVARAIQAFDGHAAAEGVKPGYEAIARAAIAAMREPTEAMMQEGALHLRMADDAVSTTANDAADTWRAMIDEALK